MFCVFCGKQIEDNVTFCPYCGSDVKNKRKNPSVINNNSRSFTNGSIEKVNYSTLTSIVFSVFLALSVIVRFANQEILVIRSLFASDDVYVLSQSGKIWLIVFIVFQSAFLFTVAHLGEKSNKPIPWTTYIFPVIVYLVEILFIFMVIPAPY